MFFNRNITTILITRDKIRSAVFSVRGQVIEKEEIYSWEEETLPAVLEKIALRGPKRIRVVFGEEFSWVIAAPAGTKVERAALKENALESIPEGLSNNWDFQKKKSSIFSSQIIAVQQQLLDLFYENLTQAGFIVEVVETQSVALSRLLPQIGTFLFVVQDEKLLIGAMQDGTVVETHVAKGEIDQYFFERWLLLVQKKCGAKTGKVFTSIQAAEFPAVFKIFGLVIENMKLDPLYSVAIKKHIKGEDSHVLNINPEKAAAIDSKSRIGYPKMTLREKMLAGIFLLIVLLGLILLKSYGKID